MAKALDPDIETHEAFRLANDILQQQENNFYACLRDYMRPWVADHYEVFRNFLDCVSVCGGITLSCKACTIAFRLEKLHSVHDVLDSFSS